MFLAHFDVFCDLTVQSHGNMESICLFNKEAKIVNGDVTDVCSLIDHKYMKEPIKIHVEISLLYKTLLII